MAKGRKLSTTRSDRFLGTTYTQASTPSSDPSDLREEDVWSTADERDCHFTASPAEWEPRRRNREGRHRHVGGLSLAFEDPGSNDTNTTSSRVVHHRYRAQDSTSSPCRHQMATSAPVNVPDWSKILRVDSVESLHGMGDGFNDDDESEMVPPHEYLARSRQMAANSVFEGVGRTLKGRDLSRVRDAVWSQTGFDG